MYKASGNSLENIWATSQLSRPEISRPVLAQGYEIESCDSRFLAESWSRHPVCPSDLRLSPYLPNAEGAAQAFSRSWLLSLSRCEMFVTGGMRLLWFTQEQLQVIVASGRRPRAPDCSKLKFLKSAVHGGIVRARRSKDAAVVRF
jgi:hypothetical protein